ncbi:MAG TPA: hypothetical protein VIW80_06270 [Pyrinomonadaceae bacterium]
MTLQTSIGSRRAVPAWRHFQRPSIEGGKAPHRVDLVLGEQGLCLLPPLGSTVQVDAHFVGKEIVYIHLSINIDASRYLCGSFKTTLAGRILRLNLIGLAEINSA